MKKLTVLLAASIGLLILTQARGQFLSGVGGDSNAAINKMADLLEKGDVAAAKKIALDVADKDDLATIMTALHLRSKKGIGVGPTPNTIVPDGIEMKLEKLVMDGITPDAFKKEGPALVRAGFVIKAVAHVALNRAPEIDIGKQKKADWLEWTNNLIKSCDDFNAAAKGSSAADLKKAANKVKQSCDSCHAVFK